MAASGSLEDEDDDERSAPWEPKERKKAR